MWLWKAPVWEPGPRHPDPRKLLTSKWLPRTPLRRKLAGAPLPAEETEAEQRLTGTGQPGSSLAAPRKRPPISIRGQSPPPAPGPGLRPTLTCPPIRSCSCCPRWTRGWPGAASGWASPRPGPSQYSSGWPPSVSGCPLLGREAKGPERVPWLGVRCGRGCPVFPPLPLPEASPHPLSAPPSTRAHCGSLAPRFLSGSISLQPPNPLSPLQQRSPEPH